MDTLVKFIVIFFMDFVLSIHLAGLIISLFCDSSKISMSEFWGLTAIFYILLQLIIMYVMTESRFILDIVIQNKKIPIKALKNRNKYISEFWTSKEAANLKIIKKYWRTDKGYKIFHSSKGFYDLLKSRYLNLEIIKEIKESIDLADKIIILEENKYLKMNELLEIGKLFKNDLKYPYDFNWWITKIIDRNRNPTLDEIKKLVNESDKITEKTSILHKCLGFTQLLSTEEVIKTLRDPDISSTMKEKVILNQPFIIYCLKEVLNYIDTKKDELEKNKLIVNTYNNLFFKYLKANLIPYKKDWFVGYIKTSSRYLDKKELISMKDTVYKVIKIKVYWKDMVSLKETSNFTQIRVIDNKYKRDDIVVDD